MHVVILLCFKRAGVQGYFKTIFFTSLNRRALEKRYSRNNSNFKVKIFIK